MLRWLLILLAVAVPLRAETVVVTGEADVSALVKRLDDQAITHQKACEAFEKERADLVKRLNDQAERLGFLTKQIDSLTERQQRWAPCVFNVVADGGCVLNDSRVDNGPLLSSIYDRIAHNGPAGSFWPQKPDGWINLPIFHPGGTLWCQTPVTTPKRSGLRLVGVGFGQALNENSYWGPNRGVNGGPVSRIGYNGAKPANILTLNGFGTTIDGIMLQDGACAERVPETKSRSGSVGLVVAGHAYPPSGKHDLRSLSIINCDTAVVASKVPDHTHADETSIGKIWTENCRRLFYSDNVQAVGWRWHDVGIGWGCQVGWEFVEGGSVTVDGLSLMSPALILKCHQAVHNTAGFNFGYVRVDGDMAGWRACEVDGYGIRLRMGGEIDAKSPAGKNPVSINLPKGNEDVVIDFWDGAKYRPWVGNVKVK